MRLIFSIYGDYTTTKVCKWLKALGKNFLRVNADKVSSTFSSCNLNSKEILIKQNGKTYNLLNCESIWYRKSGIGLRFFNSNYGISDSSILFDDGQYLSQLVGRENKVLSDFLHFQLEQKKHIGNRHNATLNKLIVLEKAKKFNLKIPDTRVVTTKAQLKTLLTEMPDLITKAISDGIYHFTEKVAYYTYTEKIGHTDLDDLPEEFSPTLFQFQIKKKFEIRSFYVDGRFFSMAIFSQSNEKTSVDFRKYDDELPNRNVPFELPKNVTSNLQALLDDLKLNSASIDLMVDINGEYVFLEINPVGQFSMVSNPCNYQLEKYIAEIL